MSLTITSTFQLVTRNTHLIKKKINLTTTTMQFHKYKPQLHITITMTVSPFPSSSKLTFKPNNNIKKNCTGGKKKLSIHSTHHNLHVVYLSFPSFRQSSWWGWRRGLRGEVEYITSKQYATGTTDTVRSQLGSQEALIDPFHHTPPLLIIINTTEGFCRY